MAFSNPQYPFTPRTLTIGGQTMSYVDEGEGPVLLMVHGNPTWSFLYRHLITALRGRFRLIAPDHIGCGLSAKPQDYPYTLATHIDNLVTLVETLDLGEFALMMHDWGGAIGMGAAARLPERVRGLIVSNTAAFTDSHIPKRIALCRLPLLGPLLLRGANVFSRAALVMATAGRLDRDARQGYLYPYDSWANRVAVNAFVRDIPMSPRHPSWGTLRAVEEGLARLGAHPMLILWGGRDFCFNDHFFAEWRRRFPGAFARYYGHAGHYAPDEAAFEMAPEIARFLKECGR